MSKEVRVNTMGELKEFIRKEEEKWGEQDREFLGEFDDQEIVLDTSYGYLKGIDIHLSIYANYMIRRW